MFERSFAGAALALTLSLPAFAEPSQDMQAVLEKLSALGAQPVHALDVGEARMQASPADAAKAVQWQQRIPSAPEGQVATRDIAVPTENGNLPARLYIPEGEGPFPVIVYFHGGGWVIADLNTYDATPRALTYGTKAITVSVDYRHAPEHTFPAAHEDAWNAYAWVVENAHAFNGDAERIAVAGESAGGNLAANVSLMAREMQATMPVAQLLVYPVAGNDTTTPSYEENAEQVPLGKADMKWFIDHVFNSPEEAADPRVNLVGRDDFEDLPPTTVILAEHDPLRSEGEALAAKMKADGVAVDSRVFSGVTHEFFGMGKVVGAAKDAEDMAIKGLTTAFEAN